MPASEGAAQARAWIELELRARRAGVNLVTATADVEIVVHGRERDVEGTSDLIRRVADGMEGAGGGPVG